jgi:hypothetical protein
MDELFRCVCWCLAVRCCWVLLWLICRASFGVLAQFDLELG